MTDHDIASVMHYPRHEDGLSISEMFLIPMDGVGSMSVYGALRIVPGNQAKSLLACVLPGLPDRAPVTAPHRRTGALFFSGMAAPRPLAAATIVRTSSWWSKRVIGSRPRAPRL